MPDNQPIGSSGEWESPASMDVLKNRIEPRIVKPVAQSPYKEVGLLMNTNKSRVCVSLFSQQNARRSHNIKFDDHPCEISAQFKYLGATPTNLNCMNK